MTFPLQFPTDFEREKWQTEFELRRRELDLKERELTRGGRPDELAMLAVSEGTTSSIDVSAASRAARGAWSGWQVYALAFYVSHGNVLYYYTVRDGANPLDGGFFEIPSYVTALVLSIDLAFFAYALFVSGSYFAIRGRTAVILAALAIVPITLLDTSMLDRLEWLLPSSLLRWKDWLVPVFPLAMVFSAIQTRRYRRMKLEGVELVGALDLIRVQASQSRRAHPTGAKASLSGALLVVSACILCLFSFFLVLNPYAMTEKIYFIYKCGAKAVSCEFGHEDFDWMTRIRLSLLVLSAVSGISAWYLWRKGMQRLRHGALQVLRADQRSPVLLLRSFADDELSVTPKSWLARALFRRRRLEEAVATQLSAWGPFIAVGQPGERVPALGAFRAYFDDDEWQSPVYNWIRECRFVVLVLGTTPSLLWEIKTVLGQGAAPKLTIVVPQRTSKSLDARKQVLATAVAGTQWAESIAELDLDRTLALRLRENGRILALRSKRHHETDYEMACLMALHDILAGAKPAATPRSPGPREAAQRPPLRP